jgi:hypothetical protein
MGYTLYGHIGISKHSFIGITLPFAFLKSEDTPLHGILGNVGMGYTYARSRGPIGTFLKAEVSLPVPGVGLYIEEDSELGGALNRLWTAMSAGTYDHSAYGNHRWMYHSIALNLGGGWEVHSGDTFVYRGEAALLTFIPLGESATPIRAFIEQRHDLQYALGPIGGVGLRFQGVFMPQLDTEGMELRVSTGPFVYHASESGLYTQLTWLLTPGLHNEGNILLNAIQFKMGHAF